MANLFRHRFRYETLVFINRATGVFVLGVGVFYLFILRKEPKVDPELLRHPIAAMERDGHRPAPTPTAPRGVNRVTP
jgi:hypothetical protein